ncbi:MAG: hypothetical protein OXK72_06030 [Gammaproteobacteria bacterium]|nr:hypothetical protein [Gammaproteobacteria bacterium]
MAITKPLEVRHGTPVLFPFSAGIVLGTGALPWLIGALHGCNR